MTSVAVNAAALRKLGLFAVPADMLELLLHEAIIGYEGLRDVANMGSDEDAVENGERLDLLLEAIGTVEDMLGRKRTFTETGRVSKAGKGRRYT